METFGSSPALIYTIAGVAVFLRFAFRELRDRKLRLERLYILPGIFAIVAVALVALVAVAAANSGQAEAALAGAVAVAVLLGFAVGSAVGHFTTLRIGERPGTVVVRGSLITVAIWIAAVALRLAVRLAVPARDLTDTAIANAALFVMLALAMFFVRYRIHKLAILARAEGVTREMTAV